MFSENESGVWGGIRLRQVRSVFVEDDRKALLLQADPRLGEAARAEASSRKLAGGLEKATFGDALCCPANSPAHTDRTSASPKSRVLLLQIQGLCAVSFLLCD